MAEEALPRPPAPDSRPEPSRPRLSPIQSLGQTAATAIGALASVDVVLALTSHQGAGYRQQLRGADIVSLGLFCVAAVLFLMWSWRAYANAVAIGRHRDRPAPRLSQLWVVLAWLVPLVNLWFPYWILADQYRSSASRPTRDIRIVIVWWTLYLVWIAMTVIYTLAWFAVGPDSTRPSWLLSSSLPALVLTEVAGAVLIILIILQITKWQEAARQG